MVCEKTILWRGFPNDRLPRIRVISTDSEDASCAIFARKATREEFSVPLSFKKLKRRVMMKPRREKDGSLAAHKRASSRAKHAIWTFGWDTPHASMANIGKSDGQHSSMVDVIHSSTAEQSDRKDVAFPGAETGKPTVASRAPPGASRHAGSLASTSDKEKDHSKQFVQVSFTSF